MTDVDYHQQCDSVYQLHYEPFTIPPRFRGMGTPSGRSALLWCQRADGHPGRCESGAHELPGTAGYPQIRWAVWEYTALATTCEWVTATRGCDVVAPAGGYYCGRPPEHAGDHSFMVKV